MSGSPAPQRTDNRQATKAPSFRSIWERQIRGVGLAKGEGKASVLAVAFVMATYANPDGTRIFPGEQRLATDIGASRSTVTRALARLRREGWVEKVSEGNSRSGQADEYRLSLPDLASPTGDRASSAAVRESSTRPASVAGDSPPRQVPGQCHHTTTTSTEKEVVQDTPWVGRSNPWAGLDDEEGPSVGESLLTVPPPPKSGGREETDADHDWDEVDDVEWDEVDDVEWDEIERRLERERTEYVPSWMRR